MLSCSLESIAFSANIPTRIEVIAGEELDEKANMKPGDIRMVLNETTGIQTHQTSATSANASIRSVYINFENFTDTRQTRFGSIYTGSISNPVYKDIYAPLDGFVVNGGLKIRL